jgi:ABC-type Co2+ transport system permease subunit
MKSVMIALLGLFTAFAFVAFAGYKIPVPQSGMKSTGTYVAFRPRPSSVWQNAQVK